MARTSLVDETENALRERLAPGRARPGDRLPPEKELAAALGVSRGTLRLALERLEANGEILRRQGSGTFVGRVATSAAFSEGLEVLESYASLARRQGRKLSARNLQIEQARVPGYVAEVLEIRRGTRAPLIQRTLLADGTVAAQMRDIVHPDVDAAARSTSSARRSPRVRWCSTCSSGGASRSPSPVPAFGLGWWSRRAAWARPSESRASRRRSR